MRANEYCVAGTVFSQLDRSFREWYRLLLPARRVATYHEGMTIEGLQNYLGARMPLVLGPYQYFRLLRKVFALVFLATLVIHLLVEGERELLAMFAHAVTIGIVYVIAVGLATTILYLVSGSAENCRVWLVWLASLTSFAFGYYFLPVDEWFFGLTNIVVDGHASQMRLSQLLPFWFVLTYIFIQPYLNEGLKSELSRLREINGMLEHRRSERMKAAPSRIHFESGRTGFTLDADAIRNVVVDDHYCYVHYRSQQGYTKRDLAMPLRDVRELLSGNFLQVHRSHIVNLNFIKAIRRRKRAIRVILDGDYEVPVSRHRLDEVLPQIRRQTESGSR